MNTLLLSVSLSACSSAGGFGGRSTSKDKDKSTDESSPQDKAKKADGKIVTDDDETEKADKPVEVAGAFLTVACAPTAEAQTVPEGGIGIGCAVVDKDSKAKYEGDVALTEVTLTFKDHTSEAPALAPAGSASKWHVLGSASRYMMAQLASVSAKGTVAGEPIDTVNTDADLYDPEALVTAPGPPEPEANLTRISFTSTRASRVQDTLDNLHGPSLAVDGNPDTAWNSGAPATPNTPDWILLSLMGTTTLRRIRLHVQQTPDGNTRHAIYLGNTVDSAGLVKPERLFQFHQDTHQGDWLQWDGVAEGVGVIKIETTDSAGSFVSWTDIEVYGLPVN